MKKQNIIYKRIILTARFDGVGHNDEEAERMAYESAYEFFKQNPKLHEFYVDVHTINKLDSTIDPSLIKQILKDIDGD